MVDECANLMRVDAPGRHDGIESRLRRAPSAQDRNQGARAQRLRRDERRREKNTKAVDRRLKQNVAIVAPQTAAHANIHLSAVAFETPDAMARQMVVDKAVMRFEIARLLRRRPFIEISGGSADHHARQDEIFRAKARVFKPPDPNRDVESLFDNIDDAFIESRLDVDFRIENPEGHRRIDPKRPLGGGGGRPNILFGFVQKAKDRIRHLLCFRPASVRLIVRVVRLMSLTPSSPSSADTRLLAIVRETPSLSDARAKLPSDATVEKVLNEIADQQRLPSRLRFDRYSHKHSERTSSAAPKGCLKKR